MAHLPLPVTDGSKTANGDLGYTRAKTHRQLTSLNQADADGVV